MNSDHRDRRSLRFIAICSSILVLLALLAHSGGIDGVFVFDDRLVILENPIVQTLSPLRVLSQPRGVALFSLQVNHAIGGTDPLGYHLLNIAIHAAAVLGLYSVLRELFVHRASHWPRTIQSHGESISLAVAGLWAVHPITSQAVTYIVQRMESMWSAAFLVGFYLFLRGTRCTDPDAPQSPGVGNRLKSAIKSPMTWSIVCFWIGMGCKEPIVASLVALPVCDRLFRNKDRRTVWRARGWYYGILFAPMLVAIPIVVLPRLMNHSETSSGGLFTQTVTPWEYWRTQPESLWVYIGKIVLPIQQCFDYLWPPQDRLLVLLFQWALFLAAFFGTVVGVIRRRPWSLFAVLFFANVSTTCLVPLIDLLVEHRVYLASAWMIAIILCGLLALGERFTARSTNQGMGANSGNIRLQSSQTIPIGLVVICGAILAVMCFNRSRVYHSKLSLWGDTVEKAPWNYRAHINYADALIEAAQTDDAVRHCRIALGLDSFRRQPRVQRAKVYDSLARALSRDGDLTGAVTAAEQAVDLTPGGSDHLMRLASVYCEHRKWAEAERSLRQAIENRPKRPILYQKLGELYAHTQAWTQARDSLQKATELSGVPSMELQILSAQMDWMLGNRTKAESFFNTLPDRPARDQAWASLANYLAKAERWDQWQHARDKAGLSTQNDLEVVRRRYGLFVQSAQYDRAAELIRQASDMARSREDQLFWSVESAKLDFRTDRQESAVRRLERLRDEHPNEHLVWSAWGDVNRWSGNGEEAIRCYQNAVKLNSSDSATLNNLGALLSPIDPTQAEPYLRRAIELDPGNHRAWHSLGNNFVRLNQSKSAIECYRRAVEIKPDFAPSLQILRRLRSVAEHG